MCRTSAKRIPLADEQVVLDTEESIMATFDFLSGEAVMDEEDENLRSEHLRRSYGSTGL